MYVIKERDPLIDTVAGGYVHRCVLLTDDEIGSLRQLLRAVEYPERDPTLDDALELFAEADTEQRGET